MLIIFVFCSSFTKICMVSFLTKSFGHSLVKLCPTWGGGGGGGYIIS